MEQLLAGDSSARLVVLGSGEPEIEDGFRRLAARFGHAVHARFTFDTPLSSLIEAGADLFLMPSRFEPCGLNQLISMRYGTPPVVRRVGGLRDTVTDATPANIAAGRATGFTFDEFEAGAFRAAIGRAVASFRRPEEFAAIRRAGMRTDWSWNRPARQYAALYEEALRRRKDASHLAPLVADLPVEPIEVALPALAPVPDGYARDTITLIPFDPSTLFCQWELGGEDSKRVLDGMRQEARNGISYDLVIRDLDDGNELRFPVGGVTRQWFATVTPGRRYGAEVYLKAPHETPRRVLDHPGVRMPPEVRPEVP
jgi:hypothetical protein